MFRIWLYLNFKNFFKSCFLLGKNKNYERCIGKELSKQSNKKYYTLFSQCRIAFFFILKYLKKNRKKNRNEIIFCAYNLPEMINVAINLNLKIKFCDLNYSTGSIDYEQLKKKITSKTLAVVHTNMFNTYRDTIKIKNLTKEKKVTLIEDNAIYFDNYKKIKGKKLFSGSIGDFSIYSFNIMKNISSFYGGACTTNNKQFINFYYKEKVKLNEFPKVALLKQIFIYFVLKTMSINLLYKLLFSKVINYAHKKKVNFLLEIFYPSLKKIKKKFPKYYFTNISDLSLRATYYQLKDNEQRNKTFLSRKNKHNFYHKKLSTIKSKNLQLIKRVDFDYQNFLDFPLLVKNKKKVNDFLLEKNIEVRFKHYYNCEKIFYNTKQCINAEKYENELICLPVHQKIKIKYMEYVFLNLKKYFSKIT